MSAFVSFLNRTIRAAIFILAAAQVAACSSDEDRARQHYDRGMKLFSDHENAKAAIELRNAVKLRRNSIQAWQTLAEIDEASSDWGRLISDLRAIVELAPDDVSVRSKLGKLLMLSGMTNEALRVANAGLDRNAGSADLHALKATAAYKLDDRANAIREAQNATEIDPANADALMVLAVDRLTKGDAKGALSLLRPVVNAEKAENNIGLQLLKIKLFGQTGDLSSVETTLKTLINRNPQEVGYRKLLVNFYVGQHRIAEAETELRNLATDNAPDPNAELDLVRFLVVNRRDPAAARQELVRRINSGGDVFPFQMALADLHLEEGNLTDSRKLLEELIRNAGTSERARTARVALARVHLSQMRFDAAESLVNDVLREDPRNVAALTIRASIHLDHLQPDAAVVDLVSALKYQPRSTEVMLLLATAYERTGLIELADKNLADATKVSNFNPRIGLAYAEFLQRRGTPGPAEDTLLEVTKGHPDDVQVLIALANLRLARQDWTGAREVSESIRKLGKATSADQIFGAALLGQGRFDEAISILQTAYQSAPGAPDSIGSVVSAFLKAKRKDQALAFLKSVLAKDPTQVIALVSLGSIELANGAPDQAAKRFSAAIAAQPNNPIGYQAMANLYLQQKSYGEAIGITQKGLQQQPDSIALRMTLANALEKKADYEGAIAQYEAVVQRQPGDLVASNNLASLLLDNRLDQPSLKRARSVAALLRNSQIPEFKDTLCWAKYSEGDYGSAISLCKEAVAALPDQPSIRYHLGMSYAAAGRPDKASEQFKKATELAPEASLAEKIKREFQ